MVTWPRRDVLSNCTSYASLLIPLEDIDPKLLLAAIAANESTVGVNCGPRHEPAWDVGGTYSRNPQQAALLAQYGAAAAMSYGPWQVMFYNAPGYSPKELNTDLSIVTRATIGYLNKQIRQFGPKSVIEVGQMWNGGHVFRAPHPPPLGVLDYCAELEANYGAAPHWF